MKEETQSKLNELEKIIDTAKYQIIETIKNDDSMQTVEKVYYLSSKFTDVYPFIPSELKAIFKGTYIDKYRTIYFSEFLYQLEDDIEDGEVSEETYNKWVEDIYNFMIRNKVKGFVWDW